MKRDSERKRLYEAKLHERKSLMHAHLSKELKGKLATKKRSFSVLKGDSVKIMRGSNKGKSAKVARVSYQKLAVYLEGISHKNAKGTEILIPFSASNLLLTDLNMNDARKAEFASALAKTEPKAEPKPKQEEKPIQKEKS